MDVVSHGTRIVYDDVGDGEPALLLMSGLCAPRTYYNHLVALSSPKRRCLVIDWPGHGDSEQPKADFGEKELLEAAKDVIRKSGARRVVPVAAAHSGWMPSGFANYLKRSMNSLYWTG
jgi:pimeloyl-ACP methyl ester carboxylesterase